MGLDFNSTLRELTCTSTSGPPTTVRWMKNGQPLTIDGSTYQQSQRVLNTEMATYENVLYSNDIANFVGNFTCIITNERGSRERDIAINGTLFIVKIVCSTCTMYLVAVLFVHYCRCYYQHKPVCGGWSCCSCHLQYNPGCSKN